ncbi:MAG: GGDEF domain-containing protein [Lachnospiraceae bacterium]|nr:GGDEF domain-containing protein [Lachnospiraceae bacterium]
MKIDIFVPKAERAAFFQSKFEYYRTLSFFSAILTALMQTAYFVTDCQIFGRFAIETLLPRFSVLLPMLILIIINPKIKSYRVGAVLYYLFPHLSMWATIWTIWYLPNRDFAREGFIIMHFAFLAVGMGMPMVYHVIAHGFLFCNIIISNLWIHYETFDMMITLAAPLFIGCVLMLLFNHKTYLDHYRVVKKIEKDALTDQLTGAFNRNILTEIFDEQSHTLKAQFQQYLVLDDTSNAKASRVVTLMLDLDKFKEVNDTYGHEAGDHILQILSDTLKKNVNESDYVIRWGGEEFLVFLMGHSYEHGMQIAEQIRAQIASTDTGICPVTVSIGMSLYNGEDYHETIRKVDRALYYAKAHGRNQVIREEELNQQN